MNRAIVVTIDGPSSSGKTTVAGLVGAALGLQPLYTGRMYRCVALRMIEEGTVLDDSEGALATLAAWRPSLDETGRLVLCGRHYPEAALNTPLVETAVSKVANVLSVRTLLIKLQQSFIRQKLQRCESVIAEGRDCGTVVWPQAHVKVVLIASASTRSQRRAEQRSSDPQVEVARIVARDAADRGHGRVGDGTETDLTRVFTDRRPTHEIVQEILMLARVF